MKVFAAALLLAANLALAFGQDTLWVAGGGTIPLIAQGTAEAVDMSGNRETCDAIPSLPQNAYGAFGAKTGGKPVICGGQHQFEENSECYVYQPDSNNWTVLADMETNRREAVVFQITENDFIVVGGWHLTHQRDTEVYTASEGSFTKGERLPYGLDSACGAKINNTHFVVSGGVTDIFPNVQTNDSLVYNALNQNFDYIPQFAFPRSNHGCGVVNTANGPELVIAGGEDNDGNTLDSVEILNLNTMVWRMGNPLPQGIRGMSSDPLGESFIIAGGFTEDDGGISDIYEYIAADDSWDHRREGIGGFFLGRGHHASVIIDDAVMDKCRPE